MINIKRFFLILAFLMTSTSFAQTALNTLKVDSVSKDDSSFEFGSLRLNSGQNSKSSTPEAEIMCVNPEGVFLIAMCDMGECEYDFDGNNIFHNFYEANEEACLDTLHSIKKIVKKGNSACVKTNGMSVEVKAIEKSEKCI